MSTTWEFFSKRKRINIKNLNHKSYDEFVSWCEKLDVIPIDQNSWDDQTSISLQNKEVLKPENKEKFSTKYTERDLRRKKKSELFKICNELNLKVPNDSTKAQLVSLILS